MVVLNHNKTQYFINNVSHERYNNMSQEMKSLQTINVEKDPQTVNVDGFDNIIDDNFSKNEQESLQREYYAGLTDQLIEGLGWVVDEAEREVLISKVTIALEGGEDLESKTANLPHVIEAYNTMKQVRSESDVEVQDVENEQSPRLPKTKRMLGRFAAAASGVKQAVSKTADYVEQSASDALNYAGAKYFVTSQSAAEKVDSSARAAHGVYKRGMDKMATNEDDTRKMRAAKKMGRFGLKAGVIAGAVTGIAAVYGGYRAGAATLEHIDHIVVPGTGSAPDQNVISGDKVTLGYEAEAGPLVGAMPYEQSVESGVQKFIDTLSGMSNGEKTGTGFSQGADVIRDAASRLSPAEQNQLTLNLLGDPSGEKGILTVAHNSPQGQLMSLLGFDTSALKDTGGATIHETRVSNDIMADASYTIADAEKFNSAVASGDVVGVLRMLASTGEKGAGYATTHAGALAVLPEDQVFYNALNPGNASVTTEQTANGTLTTITPNVTAAESILARNTGIRLTPEAREAYEAVLDPTVSHEQVVQEVVDAAQEGVNNTQWLPPEAKQGINTAVETISSAMDFVAPAQQVAPQAAPAPMQEMVQQAAPAIQQAVDTFVPPAQRDMVNDFFGQFGVK